MFLNTTCKRLDWPVFHIEICILNLDRYLCQQLNTDLILGTAKDNLDPINKSLAQSLVCNQLMP
jgi:hypothetical protein